MIEGLRRIVHLENNVSVVSFGSADDALKFCEGFVFDYLEPELGTEKTKKFPLVGKRIEGEMCVTVPSEYFPLVNDYINQ